MNPLLIPNRVKAAIVRFFTAPAPPAPLAALRIGVSAVLLLQGLAILGSLVDLLGSQGVVQWTVIAPEFREGEPTLGWFVDAAANLGISEAVSLHGVFVAYLASLVCLIVGYRTRPAAIVAWLLHTAIRTTGYASAYGVDAFAHIFLFYFIWMPIGETWSLDRRAGRTTGKPSAAARLALRVLQFHLCMVYFFSGLEKGAGIDWHTGEAIWCVLMRRDLCPFDMSWIAGVPWVAFLAAKGTLLVEMAYPIFVWPKNTRFVWATITIGMHVGICVMMGLWSFAALMSVLTFSAFLVRSEPAGAALATEPATAAKPSPSLAFGAMASTA
jgi:vitamin K-dependent gamma-carboxylase-like protein